MKRLTAKRVNGIKRGYWSSAKKDDLVQALGKYEDTGYSPEEILMKNATEFNGGIKMSNPTPIELYKATRDTFQDSKVSEQRKAEADDQMGTQG